MVGDKTFKCQAAPIDLKSVKRQFPFFTTLVGQKRKKEKKEKKEKEEKKGKKDKKEKKGKKEKNDVDNQSGDAGDDDEAQFVSTRKHVHNISGVNFMKF